MVLVTVALVVVQEMSARLGAFGDPPEVVVSGINSGCNTGRAILHSGTVGAALGVWVALIAWPVFAGRDLLRTGIDGEAIKQRFMPDQTIELTKETIEWARSRTPLAPKS